MGGFPVELLQQLLRNPQFGAGQPFPNQLPRAGAEGFGGANIPGMTMPPAGPGGIPLGPTFGGGLPPGGMPFEGNMPGWQKPQQSGQMPFMRDQMMQLVMGQLNQPNFGVPSMPPGMMPGFGSSRSLVPAGRPGGAGVLRPFDQMVAGYRQRSGNPSIFAKA